MEKDPNIPHWTVYVEPNISDTAYNRRQHRGSPTAKKNIRSINLYTTLYEAMVTVKTRLLPHVDRCLYQWAIVMRG